jgi:hypothetical protein
LQANYSGTLRRLVEGLGRLGNGWGPIERADEGGSGSGTSLLLALRIRIARTKARPLFESKILKTPSSGAYDFSLAPTFCMSFKLPTRLSKDFLNIQKQLFLDIFWMWHLYFFTLLLWYPGFEYLGLYNTSPSAYSFYIPILF